MAAQDIYVPVYTTGADGKKAYQYAKLTGTLSFTQVPEGAPMVGSRSMTTTPKKSQQPPEAPDPTGSK
jgi:hypothetical protein